jgi:hypothetical protein
MLKKVILWTCLAVLPILSQASLSKAECQIAAQNVYNAQGVLNEDKAMFEAVTAQVEAAPAATYEWSEELKVYILSIAKKLKEGDDPQKVGTAVFQGCMAKLKAI